MFYVTQRKYSKLPCKYKKITCKLLILPDQTQNDMWQRLQTLYLGIAGALIFSLFFCRMGTAIDADGTESIVNYTDKAVILAMNIICMVGEVFCIFLFRKRKVQMWLSTFVGIVLVGYQALLGMYFWLCHNEMVFALTAVFPVVAAILNFLATGRIMHDEAVVQASGRLRRARKNRR